MSKFPTLARLIITYLYFLQNVDIFMLVLTTYERFPVNLFLKSTQTHPGGRDSISYQHCERKSHVKNISVCWDFQKCISYCESFFGSLTYNKIFWDGSINVIF